MRAKRIAYQPVATRDDDDDAGGYVCG